MNTLLILGIAHVIGDYLLQWRKLAENKEKSLFGKERLKMAVCELMAEGDVSAQQLVEKVEEAVKTFVGDAEQSDDLTMLALKYTGLS